MRWNNRSRGCISFVLVSLGLRKRGGVWHDGWFSPAKHTSKGALISLAAAQIREAKTLFLFPIQLMLNRMLVITSDIIIGLTLKLQTLALFKPHVTNSLWLILYIWSQPKLDFSYNTLAPRLEYSSWCKSHSLIRQSFSSWTAPIIRQFFVKQKSPFLWLCLSQSHSLESHRINIIMPPHNSPLNI